VLYISNMYERLVKMKH